MISVAIPTGTMLADTLGLLRKAGVAPLEQSEIGRRLLVESGSLRVVLVRPTDVPAYVESGVADLGVVGKDSLGESPGSYYELLDLGFGGCRMVVAVPRAAGLRGPSTWPPLLRVASKYPLTAMNYMRSVGQTAEVIHLHGSVELAPMVGLVDAIVDLTASGRTLRENDLLEVAEVGTSSARLIANQAAMKTRSAELLEVISRLRGALR